MDDWLESMLNCEALPAVTVISPLSPLTELLVVFSACTTKLPAVLSVTVKLIVLSPAKLTGLLTSKPAVLLPGVLKLTDSLF